MLDEARAPQEATCRVSSWRAGARSRQVLLNQLYNELIFLILQHFWSNMN